MADDHGAMTADSGMDMEAHESTYAAFVSLAENLTLTILGIILLLVLWGLKGHGFIALIGLIATLAAATLGGLTGLGWKAVAPVFLLLALACIVL